MAKHSTTDRPRLRLWPGIVLVILQWLARYVVPRLVPEAMPIAVMGSLALGLGVISWWLFFSRATRLERWGGLALMVVAVVLTSQLLDPSIATAMMGMMYILYALPVICASLVLWGLVCSRWPLRQRRVALAVLLLLACCGWLLLRTDGMNGAAQQDFAWRWSPTAEERLLARGEASAAAVAAGPLGGEAEWPGFRGPGRDGVVRGVRLATAWEQSPPVEIWRRSVGPAVSSFAVHGDRLFTLEQRGEEELVSCYHRGSGELLWSHPTAERFWDSHAGAGPRSTPTLFEGSVYALGGTGRLTAVAADSGEGLWSRDAAADLEAELPGWGFAGSPLVIDDLVFVALAGNLGAYDRFTGELRWRGPAGRSGYSSPHRLDHPEGPQVLLMSSAGATAFDPADGRVLWDFPMDAKARIVQPALTADGDLLFSDGEGQGLRRVRLRHDDGDWHPEERWATHRFKPYFNDFVVHGDHAYGFDGAILASVDLTTGERNWKGGRYGHGQMLLLADQDLLLVLGEEGDLALVAARSEGFEELARFPSVLEGKTWNHPVLVGDLLLVRNGEEMAAFRLPRAG